VASLVFLVWVTITYCHLLTSCLLHWVWQISWGTDGSILDQLTVMLGFETIAVDMRMIKICFWRELLSDKRTPPSKHYNLETDSTPQQSQLCLTGLCTLVILTVTKVGKAVDQIWFLCLMKGTDSANLGINHFCRTVNPYPANMENIVSS